MTVKSTIPGCGVNINTVPSTALYSTRDLGAKALLLTLVETRSASSRGTRALRHVPKADNLLTYSR